MIQLILKIIGTATVAQPVVMSLFFIAYYVYMIRLSMRFPVAAVGMYFGTSIMNPQLSNPLLYGLPFAKFAAALCLLICLFNRKKIHFRLPPIYVLYVVFLLISLLCTFASDDPSLAMKRFEEFNKLGVIMFLAFATVSAREDYDQLFWFTLFAFWVNVGKNILETQTLGRWGSVHGSGGWIGDSNDWALALAMSLPLFYHSIRHRWTDSAKKKAFMVLTLMSALLVMTITSSRGAFLATAGSIGFLLVTEKNRMRTLKLLIPVVLIVAVYMPSSYTSQIKSIFTLSSQVDQTWEKGPGDTSEYTGVERVYFWHIAYEMMKEHPVTGLGWGNFQRVMKELTGNGVVAHSSWFQVGADAGMLGLAVFIGLILASILHALRLVKRGGDSGDDWLRDHARVLVAGLIAFVIGGSFISRENSELLFLYIAMVPMLSFAARNDPPESAAETAQPERGKSRKGSLAVYGLPPELRPKAEGR